MKEILYLLLIVTLFRFSFTQSTYLFTDTLPHAVYNVRGVAVSGNQITISSVSQDALCRMYSFNGQAYTFASTINDTHPTEFLSNVLSNDGLVLAVGNTGNRVRVYNCDANAGCTYNRNLNTNNFVTCLDISANKAMIVSGDS